MLQSEGSNPKLVLSVAFAQAQDVKKQLSLFVLQLQGPYRARGR